MGQLKTHKRKQKRIEGEVQCFQIHFHRSYGVAPVSFSKLGGVQTLLHTTHHPQYQSTSNSTIRSLSFQTESMSLA